MINKRALIITGFILLCFVAIAIRLFNIQVNNHEYYSLIAKRQQNKPQTVKAERGLIKDINGEVLAYTRDNISFYVDTRMMNKTRIDSITSIFSDLFGKKKSYYKKLIDDGTRNISLEKKVPMDIAIKLKKHVIEGMFYEEDYSRIYPYGSLASHTLGYVNKDITGMEGIEKFYNNTLTGIDGYYVFESDVMGRIISVDEKLSRTPIPGNNIELTINKTYQQILEEELDNGLKKYEGESACGIIANPNTGEIYALANIPDFDPANYEVFSPEARRNRSLIDTYEPGSTIKSITMSILLEENLAKEDEVINTENGKYKIKNAWVSDTHPHEKLTVREILEQSSNIGISKLSIRIPDEMIYKYMRDYGFTNPTSIDLPGEAAGYLKKPGSFSALTKPFLSFGYEIAVTPLQVIMAFSAIINGGTLLQPYILKKITDADGKVIETNQPKKIRSVIKESTSNLLRDMMVGVVENGTGKAAQLENVLIGGKTGTAQQLIDNAYSSKKHNSSFIGFFPADKPKIICLILIKAPQIGKYGSLVAAPIFHEVAKRIVETDLTIVPDKNQIKRNKTMVDQLISDIRTSPGTKFQRYMNISNQKNKSTTRKFFNGYRTTMPNIVNSSLRDALAQLNELGLEYKIIGNGRVIEQSIEPGAPISNRDTCFIKCEPPNKMKSARIN